MLANLRPTLRQLFALALLALSFSLLLLFYVFAEGSQTTILQSSERLQDLMSREVVKRVWDYLNGAPSAVVHFENQVQYGLVDPADRDSIESGLLSLLLANENISEATFTYGKSTGFDTDGNLQLNRMTSGQVTIWRSPAGDFIRRHTWFDGRRFASFQSAVFDPGTRQRASGRGGTEVAADPTDHLTFRTPSSRAFYGQLLRTDLHWSQLDRSLPEVSVLKTIADRNARFAGVLRVGLMKKQIDRVIHVAEEDVGAPHRVFLCDRRGRLIAGFGEKSRPIESGEDLRMIDEESPAQVTAALQQSLLQSVDQDHPLEATAFRAGQSSYLCTFRFLPDTQDWIVGIVVPRDFYLEPLLRIQRRVLWAATALIAVIVVSGGLILRNIGRAHWMIVHETARMNSFDFMPSTNSSRLRDVADVLEGLEKAKTAMRAMGKYVPMDLVRRLYRDGKEPVLGAEQLELSVLFTDIREFTPFAEQSAPDRLAGILGLYLKVMAGVIQSERGTVDKYIGDAVMAFWNAPEPVADHARFACRAALRCRDALQELYQSPAWTGEPKFETRFGLHRCLASVGHFGAPDRFNYTAIGDGINLASRLEALNKYYGTCILASDDIYREAAQEFEFRLLDRVSVKGKTQGITIYELLDYKAAGRERPQHIARYEQAFAAYVRMSFREALELLRIETQDPPSVMLAERCRCYLQAPPAAGWDGVHAFDRK